MCLNFSDKVEICNRNTSGKFQLKILNNTCVIPFLWFSLIQRTQKGRQLTQDPLCRLFFLLIPIGNCCIHSIMKKNQVALWDSHYNTLISSENSTKTVYFSNCEPEPRAPADFIADLDRVTSNTLECEKIRFSRVGLGVLSSNWSLRSALFDKRSYLIWCGWISQIRTISNIETDLQIFMLSSSIMILL